MKKTLYDLHKELDKPVIYFYKGSYFKKENENYYERTEHGRWTFSNKYYYDKAVYYGRIVNKQ